MSAPIWSRDRRSIGDYPLINSRDDEAFHICCAAASLDKQIDDHPYAKATMELDRLAGLIRARNSGEATAIELLQAARSLKALGCHRWARAAIIRHSFPNPTLLVSVREPAPQEIPLLGIPDLPPEMEGLQSILRDTVPPMRKEARVLHQAEVTGLAVFAMHRSGMGIVEAAEKVAGHRLGQFVRGFDDTARIAASGNTAEKHWNLYIDQARKRGFADWRAVWAEHEGRDWPADQFWLDEVRKAGRPKKT